MENGLEKESASLYYKGSEKKYLRFAGHLFGHYYGGCLLTPSLEGKRQGPLEVF